MPPRARMPVLSAGEDARELDHGGVDRLPPADDVGEWCGEHPTGDEPAEHSRAAGGELVHRRESQARGEDAIERRRLATALDVAEDRGTQPESEARTMLVEVADERRRVV